MADLAPSDPVDSLALPKVALQLLLIQTQQANHVIDLDKQIADLKNELEAKEADVIDRDGQITKLKSELEDLKLVLKNNPRRPVVVRLPHSPPPQLASLTPGPQSAHIRASSTSSSFRVKSDPIDLIEKLSSQLKGITTEDDSLRGDQKAGQTLQTGATPVRSIRFQEIPYQIQRKIWRYSMPGPQVLELCKIDQMQSQQPGGPRYRLIGGLPAAFHTHQLSRIEILRAYSRLTKGKTTQNDEALIKRADDIDSYTDFKHDTVYIGRNAVRGIEKEVLLDLKSWPLFDKVQYLAIDIDVCHLLAKMDSKFCDLLLHAKSLRELCVVNDFNFSVERTKVEKLTIIFENDNEKYNIWQNKLRVLDLLGLPQSSELVEKIRFGALRRGASATLVGDTTSKPTPAPAVSTTSTASFQTPVQNPGHFFLSLVPSVTPHYLEGKPSNATFSALFGPPVSKASRSPADPGDPTSDIKLSSSPSPYPAPRIFEGVSSNPSGPTSDAKQSTSPSPAPSSNIFGSLLSNNKEDKRSTSPSLAPASNIFGNLTSNNKETKRSTSPSPAPASNIFGNLTSNNKEEKPSTSPSPAPASNIFGSLPSNSREVKPLTLLSPAPTSNIFGSLDSNNKEGKRSTSPFLAPVSNIFGSLPSNDKEAKPLTLLSPAPASNIFGSLPSNQSPGFDFNPSSKPSTPAPFAFDGSYLFGGLPSKDSKSLDDSTGTKHF